MEKLNQAKRDEMPKSASPSIPGTDICALHLGTTGCSDISLKSKVSVTYTPSPGSLEASGDKKYQAGDYPGATNTTTINSSSAILKFQEVIQGMQQEQNWAYSKKH